MGQAGAQREPSMEEILASIRRIIENNEPADAADAGSESWPSDASAHSDDTEGSAPSTDAQDSAHGLAAAERPADGDAPEEPAADLAESGTSDDSEPNADEPRNVFAEDDDDAPVSLADVAARVRALPDTAAPTVADDDVDEAAHFRDRDVDAVIDDAVAAELRQALVSNDPVSTGTPVRTGGASVELTPYSGDGEAAPSARGDHAVSAHPVAAIKPDPDPSNQDEAGGQLVSLHTGEKVAAAFGELIAAIQAGQTRSFDEIAKEMLKPMLTQWLDDNLPTLVERLVREEIERVSRGDRR